MAPGFMGNISEAGGHIVRVGLGCNQKLVQEGESEEILSSALASEKHNKRRNT